MRSMYSTGSMLLLAVGCATTYPAPTQQMADVQSANRSAMELGAQSNPRAQLHLKLAQEQLKQAQDALKYEDNQAAERLLFRAKADAELAVALTRDASAQTGRGQAISQTDAARTSYVQPGVTP
jgi:hypothetical protein